MTSKSKRKKGKPLLEFYEIAPFILLLVEKSLFGLAMFAELDVLNSKSHFSENSVKRRIIVLFFFWERRNFYS